MATVTEFWRAKRNVAGIMYYTALNYCRPNGYTSDQWVDVANLVMEPHFEAAMRDAMAPVGLSVGWWQERAAAGERVEFPVVLVNDTGAAWAGDVRVAVIRDARTLHAESKPHRVDAVGRGELSFSVTLPADAGEVEVVASLRGPDGRSVRSVRGVKVGGAATTAPSTEAAPAAETPEQKKARTINNATGTGKRE